MHFVTLRDRGYDVSASELLMVFGIIRPPFDWICKKYLQLAQYNYEEATLST
jgi:hypothetical protein